MFCKNDLNQIDNQYFKVLHCGCYSVDLQSKNTKHYWHIEHEVLPTVAHCVIYHRHNNISPYHKHGYAANLEISILKIKSHDKFQLNGRKFIPFCK